MTDYPVVLPNYKHQEEEFELHREDAARALIWQMRTGKTKSMIDLACYHYFWANITGVLIVGPNGVHANWIRRELPKHHWRDIPRVGCIWRTSETDDPSWRATFSAMLKPGNSLAWFAVNGEVLRYPKVKAAIKAFIKAHPKFLLIVDEAHEFGSPDAKKVRAMRGIAASATFKRTLTGTPVAESPLKAYSQYQILQRGALGAGTYEEFKDKYSRWGISRGLRKYPVLEEYINQEELRDHMAKWSSVVLREDCDDMPELIRSTRFAPASEAQRKFATDLIDQTIIRLDNGELIDPVQGGALVIKLQQVSSGYYLKPDKTPMWLVSNAENPRLQALNGILEQLPGKAIIWCRFQVEIDLVAQLLKQRKTPYVEYHGRITSPKKRDAAIDEFQTNPKVRVFLGQPAAGGQGLDLSAAWDIVWFSHVYSAIQRLQANERATHVGGRHIGLTDILASVDDAVMTSQENKAVTSDFLAGRGLRDLLLKIKDGMC